MTSSSFYGNIPTPTTLPNAQDPETTSSFFGRNPTPEQIRAAEDLLQDAYEAMEGAGDNATAAAASAVASQASADAALASKNAAETAETNAETAQAAAEAAQAASEASQAAALASELAAAASEAAALASQIAADASADAADVSEAAALASQIAAAASEAAALVSETNAATSETNAAASAAAALSSENAAETAETNAETAQAAAEAAQAAAEASETAAATSETNAASSASAAAGSATAADGSADAAAASALAADASADAAAISASDAADSAAAAAASAASIDTSSFMVKANNLSDVTNAATARDNLGVEIGVDVAAASHTHAQSDVTNLVSDLALKAPLASPALTGSPTAPTPAVDDTDTSIATTAFVIGQAASSTSPMNGVAAVGTSKRYARQDHVHPTDTSRAAAVHTHAQSDVTNLTTDLAAKAPLASPALTGTPTAPTPAVGNNSTRIATTAYVQTELAGFSGLFQEAYDSGQQTVSSGGQLILPHGLSGKPRAVFAILTCVTAELNYSVGDELYQNYGVTSNSSTDRGLSIVPDATNVTVRYGAGLQIIINKLNGNIVTANSANWRLIIRAYY